MTEGQSTSFWAQRRVLVTGGSGFLGRAVLDALATREAPHVVAPSSAEFDLRDRTAVTAMFDEHQPDLVVHLLATAREILEEVMISTKNDFTILRSLKNGSHFLYLLIDQSSNPGMAKVAIRKYLEQPPNLLARELQRPLIKKPMNRFREIARDQLVGH